MVRGLNLFSEHFREFDDSYILIGGSACDLWMKSVGQPFRSTNDLDIVIVIETLSAAFAKRFWEFVFLAKYQIGEKSNGKKVFYRFHKPGNAAYPFMIELFSRKPFNFEIDSSFKLSPIPIDADVSSLSAILMDDDYYHFVISNKMNEDATGVSYTPAIVLIPLKVKAWLDLTLRSSLGEIIDQKDIKKHRNDVFRLIRTLTEEDRVTLPESVLKDVGEFIAHMKKLDENEIHSIAQSIQVKRFDLKDDLNRIEMIYGL
ncbi:MAG: hypothetical protein GX639_02915 [Fibrobacter sp.]|nr:hypothetical protein [Fibrobacter sp.]